MNYLRSFLDQKKHPETHHTSTDKTDKTSSGCFVGEPLARLDTRSARCGPPDGVTEGLGLELTKPTKPLVDVPTVPTLGATTGPDPRLTKLTEPPDAAPAVATVTAAPLPALVHKRRRGFMASLDGTVRCRKCGNRDIVPHTASLIFWKFWTRAMLGALVEQMREDERLNWLAYRLVKLQAADGNERALREVDGTWTAAAVECLEDLEPEQ
jgi:hypothetical protein